MNFIQHQLNKSDKHRMYCIMCAVFTFIVPKVIHSTYWIFHDFLRKIKLFGRMSCLFSVPSPPPATGCRAKIYGPHKKPTLTFFSQMFKIFRDRRNSERLVGRCKNGFPFLLLVGGISGGRDFWFHFVFASVCTLLCLAASSEVHSHQLASKHVTANSQSDLK